jgi:small subunit ribosomal protein S14
MATQAQIAKSKRSKKSNAKFSTRITRRCWKCGRKAGYMRDFDMCRICFRELASKGEIPGIVKASW